MNIQDLFALNTSYEKLKNDHESLDIYIEELLNCIKSNSTIASVILFRACLEIYCNYKIKDNKKRKLHEKIEELEKLLPKGNFLERIARKHKFPAKSLIQSEQISEKDFFIFIKDIGNDKVHNLGKYKNFNTDTLRKMIKIFCSLIERDLLMPSSNNSLI